MNNLDAMSKITFCLAEHQIKRVFTSLMNSGSKQLLIESDLLCVFMQMLDDWNTPVLTYKYTLPQNDMEIMYKYIGSRNQSSFVRI